MVHESMALLLLFLLLLVLVLARLTSIDVWSLGARALSLVFSFHVLFFIPYINTIYNSVHPFALHLDVFPPIIHTGNEA